MHSSLDTREELHRFQSGGGFEGGEYDAALIQETGQRAKTDPLVEDDL